MSFQTSLNREQPATKALEFPPCTRKSFSFVCFLSKLEPAHFFLPGSVNLWQKTRIWRKDFGSCPSWWLTGIWGWVGKGEGMKGKKRVDIFVRCTSWSHPFSDLWHVSHIFTDCQQIAADWFYSRISRLVLLQSHRIGFTPGSQDWFYSRIMGLVLLQGHRVGFTPGSPDWFYSRVTRLVLLQDHQIGFTPGSPDWFYSRITGLVLLQDHRIGFTPGSSDWFYSGITRLVLLQDHWIGFIPGSPDLFYSSTMQHTADWKWSWFLLWESWVWCILMEGCDDCKCTMMDSFVLYPSQWWIMRTRASRTAACMSVAWVLPAAVT